MIKNHGLRIWVAWLTCCLMITAWSNPVFCNPLTIKLDFKLPIPEQVSQREYLGLKEGKTFFLDQIQAQIVIIEIFSMYCPICQREASKVNQVFDLIKAGKTLGKSIKLMGIGAGNSDFEVAFFKDNYKIEFPLFSDRNFSIHKKVGEVRTPFFIGFKPGPDKSLEIFYTHSGQIDDPKIFLDNLINALDKFEDDK